jgi:xylulokinase
MIMVDRFLGIDIGSSAIKVVVLDGVSGEVVYISRVDYPSISPQVGQLEVELTELEEGVYQALWQIPPEIKASLHGLAVTGQMCGIICLDAEHRPVGRAISIFDTRAVEETEMLERHYGKHLALHEANHSLSIYTLPKVLWLREHEPERFRQTRRLSLPKDYIRGVLTGKWVTEPSDASGTLVYDQFARAWDEGLLRDLGLPLDLWPEIVPSDAQVGAIPTTVAQLTGLPCGLPVFAGAADMAAVLIGTGATTSESLVVSLGTAAHVLAPVDVLSEDIWPVQQYSQAASNSWYRFGAVFSGGASLEWFLSMIEADLDYHRFDHISWEHPGKQVLFMPYLAGAGAPHYVPEAGGAFLGLKTGHTNRDLAQAVLEGVALEIDEVYRSLDPTSTRHIYLTGGASRAHAFVEILACVLQREVRVSNFSEATGIGAAILAWRGATGQEKHMTSLLKTETRVVEPGEQGMSYYRQLGARYRAAAHIVRRLE